MYLMPATPLRAVRPSRAQLSGDRERRRRSISLSGLACHCRGGHYLDGLADDGVAIQPSVISTDLTPPADTSYVNPLPAVLVPDTSGQIQTVAPTISTTLTPPVSSAPAVVSSTMAPVMRGAAAPGPKLPFLDQQMITGVPNKYLVAGLAGILVLASAANKRR
ncbi:MAG TPA: hypothetical protein VN788_00190 [Verrucomicrobiae bacterium]|nr:hypothetical protein [Verrucomicrobiae bacterium]